MLTALLALAASCGGGDPTPATPAEPAPANTAPAGDTTVDGPGPVHTPPDGGAVDYQACVDECVRRNQMQAVGPEKIRSDCEASCASASGEDRD